MSIKIDSVRSENEAANEQRGSVLPLLEERKRVIQSSSGQDRAQVRLRCQAMFVVRSGFSVRDHPLRTV
jgi:hypothetical protein